MADSSLNEELEKLIELLSIVLEENIDCDIAEGISNEIIWEKLPDLHPLYANLFHYWNDTHNREQDAEYKIMQNNELKKLIVHLKNNNFLGARNISFLEIT